MDIAIGQASAHGREHFVKVTGSDVLIRNRHDVGSRKVILERPVRRCAAWSSAAAAEEDSNTASLTPLSDVDMGNKNGSVCSETFVMKYIVHGGSVGVEVRRECPCRPGKDRRGLLGPR